MAAGRLPEVISNPPTARIVSSSQDGKKDYLLELTQMSAIGHMLAYRNIIVDATSPE